MIVTLTKEQAIAFSCGESITLTPELQPWEPLGREYSIRNDGSFYKSDNRGRTCSFGTDRQTRKDAEKASITMRIHNRLLVYVYEFDRDWVADWEDEGQGKYAIMYSHSSDSWLLDWNWSISTLGTVYMSECCARGLLVKLNSGEVVL